MNNSTEKNANGAKVSKWKFFENHYDAERNLTTISFNLPLSESYYGKHTDK